MCHALVSRVKWRVLSFRILSSGEAREVLEGQKMLRVNEIFHSIQGESTHAGRPCVFIRLTGCNLRCLYCDTAYAHDEGESLSVEEIPARVKVFHCPLVEITGGEPLIQEDTPRLVEGLLESGYEVLLETNGSRDISRVSSRCVKIVDFKCPSSGESLSNDLENIGRLQAHDEVKFVIANREDYEFAVELTRRIRKERVGRIAVLFSAVFGVLALDHLARWILEDGLPVRLNVQLHKVIWDPHRRGV